MFALPRTRNGKCISCCSGERDFTHIKCELETISQKTLAVTRDFSYPGTHQLALQLHYCTLTREPAFR